MQPIKRTAFRILLGRMFYTGKRYLQWYFGSKRYTSRYIEEQMPHIAFEHKTPLIRKLKDVDMWMQHNKIENLKLAVKKLNKITIFPEETFSYWRLIGKPTKKKGYKDGMVLFYGSFKSGIGGGLCQLSNLIYWMTLHTPLTVTERYRHSYDVFPDSGRTQPFGSGATCSYNYRDLQIYNSTTQPFQLHLYFDEENLMGEWRTVSDTMLSYKVYEKKHWITHEYWGGYVRNNTIYRRVYDYDGILLKDELVAENHAIMMYQPFLAESKAEDVRDEHEEDTNYRG